MPDDQGFRWPPPPRENLVPRFEEGFDYPDVASVLRWFVAHRLAGKAVAADCPLARWLAAVEAVVPATPAEMANAKPLLTGDADRDVLTISNTADLLEARMLAWAVRAIENHSPRTDVEVDQSFLESLIEADLAANDPRGGPRMPGGAHTLYMAARCLHAAGGRIRIRGRNNAGRDIEWEPAGGGRVWIERKDRAFRAAYDDSEATLRRKIEQVVVGAVEKMEAPADVGRVVAFGAILSDDRAKPFVDAFANVPRNFKWSAPAHAKMPDGIYLELHAIGIRGSEVHPMHRAHFVENAVSAHRPAWQAVRPAMLAAFGPRIVPPSGIAGSSNDPNG